MFHNSTQPYVFYVCAHSHYSLAPSAVHCAPTLRKNLLSKAKRVQPCTWGRSAQCYHPTGKKLPTYSSRGQYDHALPQVIIVVKWSGFRRGRALGTMTTMLATMTTTLAKSFLANMGSVCAEAQKKAWVVQ